MRNSTCHIVDCCVGFWLRGVREESLATGKFVSVYLKLFQGIQAYSQPHVFLQSNVAIGKVLVHLAPNRSMPIPVWRTLSSEEVLGTGTIIQTMNVYECNHWCKYFQKLKDSVVEQNIQSFNELIICFIHQNSLFVLFINIQVHCRSLSF